VYDCRLERLTVKKRNKRQEKKKKKRKERKQKCRCYARNEEKKMETE
jgi:hypothetical protein